MKFEGGLEIKKLDSVEAIEAEIKMLQKKLEFYKELEKTKSPVEEAYRRWWGEYPKDDDNGWEIDNTRWRAFQVGYNYAQEDYKVGEYQEEPEENEWKNVALEFGKKLPVILPYNYDELPPDAWFRWVVFTYDKYMEQRDKESGYTPTPQTPEETEKSLREAFVKAQQTEKWKEIQKLIDEEDNNKNFKNSLDLIKEWGEKNKPPTLKELLWEWWEDIFTVNSDLDADASIDVLVDIIDKKFIPHSHNTNDYQWNKCLKIMREKLR